MILPAAILYVATHSDGLLLFDYLRGFALCLFNAASLRALKPRRRSGGQHERYQRNNKKEFHNINVSKVFTILRILLRSKGFTSFLHLLSLSYRQPS